jgi:FlaA1/EpsC-like NDP-sugar epimerase
MKSQMEYHPIGIIDEDPFLTGRQIHGVEVLGGLKRLEALLDDEKIDGVIVTADVQGEANSWAKVITVCRKHGCWVRSLRFELELIEDERHPALEPETLGIKEERQP